MFGDHQPAVEQEFYEELYGKSLSKLSTEELQQRYKIPFVIWANYDIESQDDLKTSPNYLSDLLLDTANVPKNEIENFTSEVRNDVPQINAMGHYDSDGNWVSRDEDTSNALDKYEAVEYYMLTRKENKDEKRIKTIRNKIKQGFALLNFLVYTHFCKKVSGGNTAWTVISF